MTEIVELNLFDPYPYEAWAKVFAYWACPDAGERALREKMYASLCCWFLHDRALHDLEWSSTPQSIIPAVICRSEQVIKKDLRTLERRIKNRIQAGKMGIAFAKAAEQQNKLDLPADAKRLTVNEIAGALGAELGIHEITNVTKRIWRPSLPVLPFCTAYATLAQEHYNEHGEVLAWLDAIRRREFLALLVTRAEKHLAVLTESRLRLNWDSLVQFRLVRPGSK